MKKIKEMLRRIGTAGLAAIMLTAQMPVTAFAEEPAAAEQVAAEASDSEQPAGGGGVSADEEGGGEVVADKAVSDKESGDTGAGEEAEKSGDEGEASAKESSEEKKFPAFSESKSIDGVRVTVEAEEGVFPEGATLSVEKVTAAQEKQAEEAVESERDEDKQVAVSYTYDIKVLDKDGNELQPAGENGEDSSSRVKVSFKLDEVADENLTTNVYHIKEVNGEGAESKETSGETESVAEKSENAGNGELTAEKLEVETDGDTAIAETDGFSLYTVEFTYDNKQYVLPGDSEVALSEVLDTVGLTGEVSAVKVSDESLFSAKKCKVSDDEDGNTPEKDEDGNAVEDENGTWFVFAHQAFSSEEWMKVTIGGVVYEIVVTDASSSGISYIDASGTEQTASVVTNVDEKMDESNTAFMSSSLGLFLYVNSDLTLTQAKNQSTVDAYNLILGDGKTLTVNGIMNLWSGLVIYGQREQTGSLTVNSYLSVGNKDLTVNGGKVAATSNSSGEAAISAKNVTINRGTVTATASNMNTSAVSGGVTLNGGMLTATAEGFGSTTIDGGVTLNGGTFYASGRQGAVNGTVKVAEGMLYKDDAYPCNYYFGTLSNAQKAAINGKTLSPEEGNIYAVAIGDVTRGTVTADKYTVAKDATGEARTVTLTLAPETGYSLKTLTVKDTSGNEVEISGEGDTRTFTMPNGHVTVSAVFALPTVSTGYIDENGTEQTANAVALTGGGATTLDGGWYVVPENTTVSYTGTLKFDGDTHIILADGATLNCGTKSGRINGISIEVDNGGLTVYGQSDQTGSLNAYSDYKDTIFSQNSAAFNGGTVTADSVGFCAIMTDYSVTIRRGTVNAVSSEDNTINADEGVTVAGGALNVTAPDGKYAVEVWYSSYAVTLEGGTLSTTGGTGVVCYSNGTATVKVADGMSYTDGANLYSGTLTDEQKAAIHGKTFTPAYGVIAAEGIEHGTVSASPAAFAIKDFADADKTVTLTVTPDENYTIGTVSYNDGSDHTITPVNGVYSFTMPEKDVTVNATFLKSLCHGDITIGSIAEQTYQGSGTTPSVTVKDGETTLTEGLDYTLSYSNNINVSESTAANAPTVTVTGKGNYSGMKTATFTIKARPVGIKAEAQSVELNGEIATGTDKVEVLSGELVSGHSIYSVTVATENTRNAVGTFDGAITASGALIRDANGNDVTANYNITYTAGTLTVTKVKAKVTTVPTAKMGLIYSGESQTLLDANGVADTSMEYALGSDADTAPVSGYSETVPGGTDAKTYYIWYRAKEDENHEAGEPAVLTVEIAKATPNITTVPTAAAITYGQTLNESTLTGGAATLNETDVNGDFTWSDATVVPQVSDSSKTEYTVKFTPNDSVNFNEATCKVKLIVNKAEISGENITAPTAISNLSYTGSAQELINGGSVTGNTSIMYYAVTTTNTAPAGSLYTTTIPTATNAGTYYVWYKVKGDANHNDVSAQKVPATISKADSGSDTASTVQVQKGDSVDASVNIRGYVGTGAVRISTPQVQPDNNPHVSISDIKLSDDKNNLTFKVSSVDGGTSEIIVTLKSDNYESFTLTVPVEVKAKTTEVKLETPTNVETSVQDVQVSGLESLTNSLNGSSVKVELQVKPESEPSDGAIKTEMEKVVAKIFTDLDSNSVKKEYLDISVKQTVDNTVSTPADVKRVIDIAVKYDLTGKYNPVVVREHGDSVKGFTPLASKPATGNYQDGTYFVDRQNNTIHIYSRYFSTYTIAYTTVASYTVTFDAQGGDSVDPMVVAQNGTISTLPSTTRSGYNFDGWYTATSGGTKLTKGTPVTDNVTYYAQWTQNSSGGGGGSGGSGDSRNSGGSGGSGDSGSGSGSGTVTPPSTTLEIKQKQNISSYLGTTYKKYQYSQKGIVSISSKGVITAKKAGTVKVTGCVKQGKNWVASGSSVTLTVEKPYFAEKTLQASYAGQKLYAANNLKGVSQKPSSWQSSKSSVATIDSSTGEITALKGGSAKITAVFGSGSYAAKYSFNVKVNLPRISKKTATLITGGIVRLKMNNTKKTVTWSTDNSGIAVVSGTGEVTAKNAGQATITATVEGQKYDCTVTVRPPAIRKATMTIRAGRQARVGLKNTKLSAYQISWRSSDTSVARVDASGYVTGVAPGTAVISTTAGGVTNSCTVTVRQ